MLILILGMILRNERLKTGIPGRFSVYNSLAAICVAQKFGIDSETIKQR